MNRRRFLLMSAGFTLLSTTAARADYVEDIVKWLTKEGFSDIDVTRTLLGRVRIVASKDGQLRELVCNPRTGEILRDVWSGTGGGVRPAASSPSTGDDDNNDDDNGGGDDDDNSGQGGSGDDNGDNSGDGGEDDDSGDGGDDDSDSGDKSENGGDD